MPLKEMTIGKEEERKEKTPEKEEEPLPEKLPVLNTGRIMLALLLLIVILMAYAIYSEASSNKDTTLYIESGLVHYPMDRGSPAFTETLVENTPSYKLSKIRFESLNGTLYALYKTPVGPSVYPLAIILPGATVGKFARQNLADALLKENIASLTLDQRGINESTEVLLRSFQDDFTAFTSGQVTSQALMSYDALKAFDVARSLNKVDGNRIALIGESMGGRFAMIAGASDQRIRGVVVISSAGYGESSSNDKRITDFINSVNPDSYLPKLSGRLLVMLHSPTDQIILISQAQQTFGKAGSPKRFYEVHCPSHGYCSEMDPLIVNSLQQMFP